MSETSTQALTQISSKSARRYDCIPCGMALIENSEINPITERVISCAIRVHRRFGPGLLEVPYKLALAIEFTIEGMAYRTEVPVCVMYAGRDLGAGYRMDFVVEGKVVVEVKAIERLLPIHRQQLVTYLTLSGYPAGLMINFNVRLLKDGVIRVLNDGKPRDEDDRTVSAR